MDLFLYIILIVRLQNLSQMLNPPIDESLSLKSDFSVPNLSQSVGIFNLTLP